MLVRKKDGAFLYGTTDLATIRYRMETWRPDAILYVVDHRQSLHFKQLFAAARLLGYDDVELQHVSFGTVLGDDGPPLQNPRGRYRRPGKLARRSRAACARNRFGQRRRQARGPELSDRQRRQVAESVGIAALKYADLSQNRTSDYVFSYDKMLAMSGNTATYMQYAYARVRSIFAKGNIDVDALPLTGTVPVFSERPRFSSQRKRDCPPRRQPSPHRSPPAPDPPRLAGRAGAGRRTAPLFRSPRHDGRRLSSEPTDGVSFRPGESLFDVFRAMPRASRPQRRASPKPPAPVRSDRPDDPEGLGAIGDRGGREDVGEQRSV